MAFTQEQLDNLADNNPDLHDKMWSKASDKLREMSVRDFEWELIDEDSTNGKVAFSVFQSICMIVMDIGSLIMEDKRDD